ncbi:MAG TPA: (4Fe-4S)-binding protein [Syntrophaceae bacterium]|jgi:MinD superfamily P-loop ATPase|nr:(4Fe-4S)-binding protein [Syntrophaceae bacterium]
MKQIVIISGKGGTGKTVLTASFASLAHNKVMVDCDVDAADLHLLLHPSVKERFEFRSGQTARIDKALCVECGKCIDMCRFDAIGKDFIIDPIACEGCGLCSRICVYEAIVMEENISGEWFISDTRFGPFVHARLGIAEDNSGKLVSRIRQAAKEIAVQENKSYILIDGPPGIGCPVIASITDTDLAVIVTEPTLSGIHDMLRIIDTTGHFQIPVKVVINKYDLNLENTRKINDICESRNIEIVGRIPFSAEVPRSLVQAVPFVEYAKDEVTAEIISIWNTMESILQGKNLTTKGVQ